jgi:hypothetical protein
MTAQAAERAVLPVLALVMTLSVMGVRQRFPLSESLVVPALLGLLLNYGLLAACSGAEFCLIRDDPAPVS